MHVGARTMEDTPQDRYPTSVAEGVTLPYRTFVPTRAVASLIPEAGTGLFASEFIEKFSWIGMYPGKVTAKTNRKLASHTMGTARDLYIIADPAVHAGVHMVNEAAAGHGAANVWYVKLSNSGFVLYFAGEDISPGDELYTCYSRSYMKRTYPVPKTCADPRCAHTAKHRTHSELDEAPEDWREELRSRMPSALPPHIFS